MEKTFTHLIKLKKAASHLLGMAFAVLFLVAATLFVPSNLQAQDLQVVNVTHNTPPFVPGEIERFTYSVTNNGAVPVTGATVTFGVLDVPLIVEFVQKPGNVGWNFLADGTFTKSTPFPAGATYDFIVDIRVPSNAAQLAQDPLGAVLVAIAGNEPDPNQGNNEFDLPLNTQAIASFRLEKRLLTPEVAPGGTAMYEITVCNEGPSDIDNVAINDVPGVNLVPGSLVLSPDAGNLYVAAGMCVRVLATAQVDPAASPGQNFVNTVSADVGSATGGPGTNMPMALNTPQPLTDNSGLVVNTLPATDVEVVDIVELHTNNLTPGKFRRFQITVQNNGPAIAYDATVNFQINDVDWFVDGNVFPPGWTYIGNGSWSKATTMAPGEVAEFFIRLYIPSDAAYVVNDGIGPAWAYISAANPETNIDNNDFAIQLCSQLEAQLTLDKQLLTPTVAPGGTALYEIVVCNNGPSDIAGIAITDVPGANLEAGTLVMTPGSDDLYLAAGQCKEVLASVQVSETAAPGSTFGNTASVDASGMLNGPGIECTPQGMDPAPIVNEPSDSDLSGVVVDPLPDADVEVVSSTLVNGPIVPGTTATFEFTVRNNGPAPAYGATIGVNLLDVNWAVDNNTVPGGWTFFGDGVFVATSPMVPGVDQTFTIELLVPSDAAYFAPDGLGPLSVMIGASNPDPIPGNNVLLNFDLDSQIQANLTLDKTLLTPLVAPGGTALYEVVVCNNGPSDVAGVGVNDIPGVNLDPLSVVISSDADNLYIPAGQCVDLLVSAQVADNAVIGDDFCNSAEVDLINFDNGVANLAPQVNAPADNDICGEVDNYLPTADVDIDFVEIGPDPVASGGIYQFELVVTNNGPAPAEHVIAHVNFLGLSGYTILGQSIPAGWNFGSNGLTLSRSGTMPAGASETLSFTIEIPLSEAPGFKLAIAGVSASNPDPDLFNLDFDDFEVIDITPPTYINCPTTMLMVAADPDECSAKVNWSIPVAVDNHELFSNVQTAGPTNGSIIPVGPPQVVIYTATDVSGNQSSCTFQVQVVDTEIPEFDADIIMPNDTTVNCHMIPSNCVYHGPLICTPLTNNDVNDNCTASADLLVEFEELSTQDPDPAVCGHYDYILTRIWTVTDEAGNELEHVQVITVQDTTKPDAVCQNITVTLDKFGEASIQPEELDGGSTDNCAPPEVLDFMASQTDFTCADLGDNVIILTVTDPCDNFDTCESVVTVVEGIAPCIPEYDVDGSEQCVCLDNATTLLDGQFSEFVQIKSLAGQTWTLASSTGVYSIASAAPPAAPTALPNGTALTPGHLDGIDNDGNGQIDEADEMIYYTISFIHVEAQGYLANFQNDLGQVVTVENTCYYPTPEFENLDGPFCLNTPPFEVIVSEKYGADGTVTIFVNGEETNIINAAELGLGAHEVVAIFDAGTATPYLLVNGVQVDASNQDALEDPGCIQEISTTINVIETPEVIACNDLIQISLEGDCVTEVTQDMILEGSYYCFDDYTVTIGYPAGTNTYNPPNMVDASHVGYTLTVSLDHVISGNVCWGQISVEDKWAPEVECPEDTEILCTQDPDDTDAAGNLLTGEPSVFECSDYAVEYSDEYTQYTCDENSTVSVRIIRTFVVADEHDNVTTCTQTIDILRGSFDHVDLPPSVEYDCNALPSSLDPDVTGWPQIAGTDLTTSGTGGCGLGVEYEDHVVNTCPGSYKIVRDWTLYDWCPAGGGDPTTTSYTQYIKVLDVAPEITLPGFLYDPVNDWYVISANGYSEDYSACAAFGPMPTATVDGVCNNVTNVFIATEVGNVPNGGFLPEPGLVEGPHQVTYTATDECGNITKLTVTIYVKDDIAPTAICDQITDVDVTSDGMAIVPASVFDDGSYDNCCLDKFEVRRMDGDCDGNFDDFGPDVKFCCSDAGGDNIIVVFRAYDCEGNYNDCMVQVEVNDKLPPLTLDCPDPAEISCEDYLENYAAALDAEDYSVLEVFGEALFYDNCGLDVTYDVTVSLDQCAEGTITRSWTANDPGGNFPATCTQTISVFHVSDWVVEFPADFTGNCVDGELPDTGAPEVFFDECELIGVSHEDELFDIVPDACYKIVRTWTVINWCVYEDFGFDAYAEISEQAMPGFQDWDGDGDDDDRTFRDGMNNSGDNTPDGYIEYEQVIKVIDDEAPIYDVEDFTVCIEEVDCDTDVELPVPDITDCSPITTIVVTSSDLAAYATADQYAYADVPVGTYVVDYAVTDECGNTAYDQITVTVEDCKKPTPYCKNGLVIEIMQTGMIDVFAGDFDAGSFDNCPGDLQLSFSPDVNDIQRIYDCTQLGQQDVEIWVTDAAGNQDFCETFVIVQDNMDHCGSAVTATVAGLIETEDAEGVENVSVEVNGGIFTQTTIADGSYQFILQAGGDYSVTPSLDENPMNGVTTWDLVLITRHILGVQVLDTPYKVIAADANNSQSVTTLDIVEIRKVILQINDNFHNNTSWRFVDEDWNFVDPMNPFAPAFPEVMNFNNLAVDELAADFVAVKVGDVNSSAQTNSLGAAVDRNFEGAFVMNVADTDLQAGKTYTVDFDATDLTLQGYQFTLNFNADALELIDIEEGVAGMENFGLSFEREGVITSSWHDAQARSLSEGERLFGLTFRATADGSLSELLNVNSRYTPAEAYGAADELLDVQLNFTGDLSEGFALYQNVPNPFEHTTIISFRLPQTADAQLTITDASGRVLKVVQGTFAEGYNEVRVDGLDAAGLLYYRLDTPTHTATKKMIIID